MRRLLGLLGVGLFCLAASAPAREIYVDNRAGDDRFDGANQRGSQDLHGPVRTIGRALRVALGGDRIVLANTGEPYRESISLVGSRHSGIPLRDFIIEGNGSVLDGSAPVPPDAWEHYREAVFRFEPPGKQYQQLFLQGRPAPRVFASSLRDAPPDLEALEWCLHEGRVYFGVEPTKLPEDYPLSFARERVGITLYHVDKVTIADLTIQGFQLDGIQAANTARNVRLLGVILRGNGRSGLTVGGASLADIDACLMGNNGQAQILTLPYSETHVRNSEILGNTAPARVAEGGRFFLGAKEVHGGLDQIKPDAAP